MPTGSDIMTSAGILLNDEDHIRWSLPELCRWINDGVKAIIIVKPSASSTSIVMEMQKGTLQKLPVDANPKPLALIDIKRNLRSADADPRQGGRVIRRADRALLDAQDPDWHDETKVRFKKEVRSYVFDDSDRLEFFVYPGNDGTGIVEAVVSTLPPPLTANGSPTVVGSYGADLGIDEPLGVPLLDYVLYRSQLKDAEGADGGRAAAHYQQFATALGVKVQTEKGYSPNARPS